MPGVLAWGWYVAGGEWLPVLVDSIGRVRIVAEIDHLNDIGDVDVASPTDDFIVYWDATAAKWKARALVAADIPNLAASKITSGIFPIARGGTGLSTIALGGILYASALDTLARLAPSAANQVLRSTGANALQFAALVAADIPTLDHGLKLTGLGDDDHTQYVLKTLFTAYSILYADTSGIPVALTIAASRIIGRKSSGGVAALTVAQVLTLLGVEAGATADLTGLEIVTLLEALVAGNRLDHGAGLTGLGDDDHTQYQKEAEKDAASGYMGLDASSLGNSPPQAHKDRHDPEDGADPLDGAAPSELAGVQAAGEGSAHELARADHAHQIQAAITDDHLVTIDDADAADDDYAKLTANGLEGRSYAEVLADIFSVDMPENLSMTLDDALSADGKWCAIEAEDGVAGETLAFGECVYFKAADSRWWHTDADAEATAKGKVGFVILAAGSGGDATKILLRGKIRADTAFPALTIGAEAFIGTTPGAIQVAAPSGSGDIVRVVGHANTADELAVNISPVWLEIA